jgi:multidrug efflux system outer membrane protein
MPDAPAFKSAASQPSSQPSPLSRQWWTLFSDPKLNELEDLAFSGNFDLQASMARVIQARAASRGVKSQFLPVIGVNPKWSEARSSANGRGGVSSISEDNMITTDLSYEVDIWGKISRGYEASVALAVASEDAYGAVRLTLAAQIAQTYFSIRSLDAQSEILNNNVKLYEKQLALSKKKVSAGIGLPTEPLQIENQLQSALSQEIEIRRQRTDLEHAIAILLGKAPVELDLKPMPLDAAPPTIPVGLPSELLRNRPDVNQAEQNLIAANAQIGVAKAAYYPSLKLTGSAGFEALEISHIADWESRLWSAGAGVSIPLFQGQLDANLQVAKAKYEELTATYRSTLLTAFRDVEDALTDLHFRSDQALVQQKALAASREYLRLTEIQYDQGIANSLQVIDADKTLLQNELQVQQNLNNRMISTILLVKALGGGWTPSDIAAPTSQPAESD